jgi:hypothetical protein
MRVRAIVFLCGAAALALVLAPRPVSACHQCHQNPCVLPPPRPTYQCVTEVVPYTVTENRTRVEFRPVTETVMVPVPETTWTECQRVVCKPVYDTKMVPRQRVICKPVYDTTYVTETFTVCRPVQTTRQVTEYSMQPSTRYVSVVARNKCGLCGHARPACTCQTVALTCYTPVPVVRDVVCTTLVPEVQTRQVPVTSCRMVREVTTENVPVTSCRLVREVVTDRIPHTTVKCVPQTVTRQVPYPVCEQVQVTRYREYVRMVPVPCAAPGYAAPQNGPAPSGQGPVAPTGQGAPSKQA